MKYIAILLIRFYQLAVSPFLGKSCRFKPTCSQYGIEAIQKYGFFKGIYLLLIRLSKCGPWHEGGEDLP